MLSSGRRDWLQWRPTKIAQGMGGTTRQTKQEVGNVYSPHGTAPRTPRDAPQRSFCRCDSGRGRVGLVASPR